MRSAGILSLLLGGFILFEALPFPVDFFPVDSFPVDSFPVDFFPVDSFKAKYAAGAENPDKKPHKSPAGALKPPGKPPLSFASGVSSQPESKPGKKSPRSALLGKKPFPKKCPSSGEEILLRENSQMDFYIKFNSFNSENIEKVAAAILGDSARHCPENCVQENNYKSYVTVRHVSAVKNSCPPEQAKEVYLFKKEFTAVKGKKAKKTLMRQTGEKMNEWLAKTFIFPYLPFPLRSSSKEHEADLKSACPSCSFRLAYDYVFTNDGKLSLDLKVRCGAMKKSLFSPLRVDLTVKNHWKCRKPPPE